MKKILFFLALIFTSGIYSMSYADEPGTDEPGTDEPKRNLPKKNQPSLPGIYLDPSCVNSSVGYNYNSVHSASYFFLPADVEYIDIEAENLESHIIYVGSVWAENPVWKQELPAGEYIITCTADNGDVYEGYVCL